MRDTRETVAMLTPHGIGEVRAFGGVPSLTGMDVAGAMGMGLSRLGAELLFVKYALDDDLIHSLRVTWFMHVMEHKMQEGWKSHAPGKFKGLSDTTLAENISPNLCNRCGGRGYIMPLKKAVTCPQCGGSTKQYPSERAMARGVGVSVQSYRETWTDRVKWCRDELEKHERVAVSLLWARLRP